jgi:hypothetical protein
VTRYSITIRTLPYLASTTPSPPAPSRQIIVRIRHRCAARVQGQGPVARCASSVLVLRGEWRWQLVPDHIAVRKTRAD